MNMENSALKFESRLSPRLKNQIDTEFLIKHFDVLFFRFKEIEKSEIKKGRILDKKDYSDMISIIESKDEEKRMSFIEKFGGIEFFTRSIEWGQEISRLMLSVKDISDESTDKIEEAFERAKKINPTVTQEIISGIKGVNGAITFLESQGYEVLFADSLEDAAGATDLFVHHSSYPDIIWFLQVKAGNYKDLSVLSPADMIKVNMMMIKQEEKMGNQRAVKELDEDLRALERLENYSKAFEEYYNGAKKIFPLFFGVPAKYGAKFDLVTGIVKKSFADFCKRDKFMLPLSRKNVIEISNIAVKDKKEKSLKERSLYGKKKKYA